MWRTRHGHGVIGRCGSSAGAARRYRRHQRMGHHPYRGLGASADPLAGAQVRGELAGAGMTGAQRRGRDDHAPSGVEVDPHRRARVGWARRARQVDGPRFAAQGPDWQPGCGLAQDPDSKPVGDAHPIRRANDRHRSSRRAHPGPRVRRVSCRVDRTLLFPARVESTPVTPVVVLLHSLQRRAWACCAGALAPPRVGQVPGPRVLGFSGPRAPPRRVRVACLSLASSSTPDPPLRPCCNSGWCGLCVHSHGGGHGHGPIRPGPTRSQSQDRVKDGGIDDP
jgi:hypothetical protein